MKEFETKRQDTEVENIFGVLERVSELRSVFLIVLIIAFYEIDQYGTFISH